MRIDLSLSAAELAADILEQQRLRATSRALVRHWLRRNQPTPRATTDLRALARSIALSKGAADAQRL